MKILALSSMILGLVIGNSAYSQNNTYTLIPCVVFLKTASDDIEIKMNDKIVSIPKGNTGLFCREYPDQNINEHTYTITGNSISFKYEIPQFQEEFYPQVNQKETIDFQKRTITVFAKITNDAKITFIGVEDTLWPQRPLDISICDMGNACVKIGESLQYTLPYALIKIRFTPGT